MRLGLYYYYSAHILIHSKGGLITPGDAGGGTGFLSSTNVINYM